MRKYLNSCVGLITKLCMQCKTHSSSSSKNGNYLYEIVFFIYVTHMHRAQLKLM